MIDKVSFCCYPVGLAVWFGLLVNIPERFVDSFQSLFNQQELKNAYAIDAYYVPMNQATPEEIIKHSIYWYSLWSHTRDGKWKGYLQIDLASSEDEATGLQLSQLRRYAKDEGGQA